MNSVIIDAKPKVLYMPKLTQKLFQKLYHYIEIIQSWKKCLIKLLYENINVLVKSMYPYLKYSFMASLK